MQIILSQAINEALQEKPEIMVFSGKKNWRNKIYRVKFSNWAVNALMFILRQPPVKVCHRAIFIEGDWHTVDALRTIQHLVSQRAPGQYKVENANTTNKSFFIQYTAVDSRLLPTNKEEKLRRDKEVLERQYRSF